MTVKVASSIFVNQLNATKPRSSKTQFQFQFELSLAQLSPSLFRTLIMMPPLTGSKSLNNPADFLLRKTEYLLPSQIVEIVLKDVGEEAGGERSHLVLLDCLALPNILHCFLKFRHCSCKIWTSGSNFNLTWVLGKSYVMEGA